MLKNEHNDAAGHHERAALRDIDVLAGWGVA
jgi:hypothetical protein